MGERRGTRGLELWCKRMTEGYPGVKIENMTTSWRDGLAFCAIIHRFRPDLIDFSKLNKDDVYRNNELAFTVAEQHLGIPALLEPEDMVEFPVPDRLSILTYLSQFYQTFVTSQGSPSRIVTKRPSSTAVGSPVSPNTSSPPAKVALLRGSSSLRSREPCAKCNLPVFLAERLNLGRHLYHRTCFRCARCNSQLTTANYYETEAGEYCCETCPDEESPPGGSLLPDVLRSPLDDEQKLKNLNDEDEYSECFETAVEEGGTAEEASSMYKTARLKMDGEETAEGSGSRDSGFPERMDDFSTKELSRDGGLRLVKERMRLFESRLGCDSVDGKIPQTISESNIEVEKTEVANYSKVPYVDKSGNLDESVIVVSDASVIEISDAEHTKISASEFFESNENAGIEETTSEESKTPNVSSDVFESSIETNEDCQKEPKTESSIIVVSDGSEAVIEISNEERSKISSEILQSNGDENQETTSDIQNSSDTSQQRKSESSLPDLLQNHLSSEEQKLTPKKPAIPTKPESLKKETKNRTETTNDASVALYPDDLNPFGDEDEDQKSLDYDMSLNPFGSDDDADGEGSIAKPSPKPRVKKKVRYVPEEEILKGSPAPKMDIYIQRQSFNPFEEDAEKEEVVKKKVIPAPRISLNFPWEKPVPSPRNTNKSSNMESEGSLQHDNTGVGRRKKKKPAPKPPTFGESADSSLSSLTSSPNQSVHHSPRLTPRRAPPPPTSTPYNLTTAEKPVDISPISPPSTDDWENHKESKEVENRTIRAAPPDKSTYGKWKRKKGMAPPRPVPQRREVRSLSIIEIKRELDMIEVQQRGLERQGVRLEQMIREKSEGENAEIDVPVNAEVEDMILQLFELINLKNELFRKQAELMYLRRQQRLEEEYADIEYQIRCLMLKPTTQKTDSDKSKEEELIKRLVEVVERRDEIVQCLEMDRVREAEEDRSINDHLNMYTLKKEEVMKIESDGEKKSKKEKKKHKKKTVDLDKDIDESEVSLESNKSSKEKKKKKFNIF